MTDEEKLSEWIAHARSEGSVHVAVPVDVAERILLSAREQAVANDEMRTILGLCAPTLDYVRPHMRGVYAGDAEKAAVERVPGLLNAIRRLVKTADTLLAKEAKLAAFRRGIAAMRKAAQKEAGLVGFTAARIAELRVADEEY